MFAYKIIIMIDTFKLVAAQVHRFGFLQDHIIFEESNNDANMMTPRLTLPIQAYDYPNISTRCMNIFF